MKSSVVRLTLSERAALISGIISVALALVAGVNIAANVLTKMPPIDAPAAQIAAYLAAHAAEVTFANYLFTPQVAFYLFFLGGLYSILRRAEGESRVFTFAAVAAGLVMVAPWFLDIVLETSSYSIARMGGDPAIVSTFNGMGPTLYALGGFNRAVLVVSVSTVLLQSRLAPRWVSWLGYGVAAISILGTGTFLTADFFPATILSLLLFGVWLVAMSVALQLGARTVSAPLAEAASAEPVSG